MTAASGAARLPTGPLILASTSRTRRRLLEQAGFGFETCVASIDEVSIRQSCAADGIAAGDVAVILAEMKGRAASAKVAVSPGTQLLAADQILEIDGEMLGKPADRAGAAAQLARLQGRAHRLLTAAVIFRDGERIWHHLAEAKLTMRSLDQDEIESYLDLLGDAALWSPGSYQIEALGMHLFSRIEGCHYGILGLPLLEITAFLRGHGLMLSTEAE
ncbi:MAG: nucleoside triphosphate pyrophosphatase [Pseudomonadota bacterium]|nr:nucleoside triphosphate pyrophosphatase [Pseudomonadota bacterium]